MAPLRWSEGKMRHSPELPDIFGDETNILETLLGANPPDGTGPAASSSFVDKLQALVQQLGADWDAQGHFGSAGSGYSAPSFSSGLSISDVTWPDLAPVNVGPPDGAGPGGSGGGGGGPGNGGGGPGGGGGGGSDPTLLATYTSGSEVVSDGFEYNITYNFWGTSLADWGLDGLGVDLVAAFVDAADYLTSFIGENGETAIDPDLPDIDDIIINVTLESIDGSGGTLGSAAPEIIRGTLDDPGLPLQGSMTFDIADALDLYDTWDASSAFYDADLLSQDLLEQNLWDDVVLHETLHVLGIGSLWDLYGLSVEDDNGTPKPTDDTLDYTGALAEAEWGGDLLIETDGGSGTAGGHWDEETYGDELMTGYINLEGNHLSSFSIAALADLGYNITSPYDAAALESINLSTFGGSYLDADLMLIA